MFNRETDVIRNKQVKVPITVVVQETASRAPPRLIVQEPGSLRDIGEGAITIVAVENVLSEVGAEHVFKSVVIVVPDADAGGPTNGMETRLLRNIRERPVAIVLVQAVSRFGGSGLNTSATEQKYIHPAVVVVVNECTSAAGRLQNVFLTLDAPVDCGRTQSGGGRYVDKVRVERAARRGLPYHGLSLVSRYTLPQCLFGSH